MEGQTVNGQHNSYFEIRGKETLEMEQILRANINKKVFLYYNNCVNSVYDKGKVISVNNCIVNLDNQYFIRISEIRRIEVDK